MKISATIILLLLISVYGYLKFRESHSYNQIIAKNAHVVFKLNVDGLLSTMATDFIGNPGYYLKNNEKGVRRPGFSIPANIFFYSLNTGAPSSLYSSLALGDTTGLNAYLKRVLKIKDFRATTKGDRTGVSGRQESAIEEGAEQIVGTSADRKITVAYDRKILAIAYSFKRESVMEELNDILDQKNRMEDAAPLMLALKKAKGHLSWTTTAYTGEVNFKDGGVEIDGLFPTEGLEIPTQPHSSIKFADNSLISIWINAGFSPSWLANLSGIAAAGTTKTTGELSLNGISLQSATLLKSYLGFAAVEIGPGITQIDSLITYEYNDDFEKVPTVQLKKVIVPHLKVSILAKTGELTTYLRERQVILVDDQLNKEVFPLYQVFSSQQDPIWQLSTLKNDPISLTTVENEIGSSSKIALANEGNQNFFFASADLKEIKVQQLFPLLNSWIAPFTHFEITAAQAGNGTARLRGNLELQRPDLNAFIQMIR
ncbi:hypothetical protein [Pedobacter gandavensis]|uniref:DUF945 family protein n=1 Tax=Pedobacter gandavensis TaxID=2679963 RepID=A0ABR6ER86_9SPHI|nr:hypothetical protein [Pedobacter gandavensis]MBB2147737.1 hypothetical protein [Pedobacter gandavensis]